MKTFTKHILLLALMLFGVAGAAWALPRAPQKFTDPVAFSDLVVGDTLAPGFSITGLSSSQTLSFQGNRYKQDGVLEDGNYSFYGNNVTGYGGDNPVTIIAFGSSLYTPVNESGQDGNAWVVTATANNFVRIGGISLAPDPTVPALDETTGHWNFLMPGSNKVVKAVLYDSIVLGPHVELYDADPAFAAGDIYTRGDSTIYYYDTNNHHSFYLRADEQADSKYFGYWADLDPTDYYYTDRTYRRVSTGSFTCGQRFTAAYLENHTLTLNPSAGGTLSVLLGDGIIDASARIYTLTFTGFNNGNMNTSVQVNASEFPVTLTHINGNEIGGDNLWNDFAWVNSADASNDDGKMNCSVYNDYHNFSITISGAFDGTANIHVDGANGDWGGEARDISVSCVLTTNDIAYSVMEGLTVNVTATPDSAHYLSAIDGHDTVGNYATGYSFVMPSNDYDLLAVFNAKPTLTLTQTDGGTLEAIVPQGGAIENIPADMVSTGWQGNFDTRVTLDDLQAYGFMAVDEAVAAAWTGAPASGYAYLIYGFTPEGKVKLLEFWDGINYGTTVSFYNRGYIYNNRDITYFTTGTGTSNVTPIANTNTYIIDYGTPVTVVATPDAQHYLVSFSDDDPATERNSNIAVEKTYDSVIAPKTLSANFQAKPTLTLAHNDGGTMTLDGMVEPTPAIATIQFAANGNTVVRENVTLPHTFSCSYSYENGELDQIIKSLYEISSGYNQPSQPPTASGNDNVTAGRNYNNHFITISAPFEGTAAVTGGGYWKTSGEETEFEYNLTITILSSTPGSTGLPAGVVSANATLDTFVVDYGTTLTVQADATELHHVANWVNEDSVAYPADSITYSDYFITEPEPLFPAHSTLRLTVTADATAKAVFGINSYDVTASVAPTTDVRGTVRIASTDVQGAAQVSDSLATVTATAQGGSASTLTAYPAWGYHFVEWQNQNGTQVSTDNPLAVTSAVDTALVAVFDTTKAELAWSDESFTGYTLIDPNNWAPTLTNSHNVEVRYGCVEGTLNVDAQSGIVGVEVAYGFIPTTVGTYHIYAVHDLSQEYFYDSVVYTLTVERGTIVSLSQNIETGGTAVFADKDSLPTLTHYYASGIMAFVAHGHTVDLVAEPAEGYHFTAWQEGDLISGYTDIATSLEYTYTVPDATTIGLKAVFDTNVYNVTIVNDHDTLTDLAMGVDTVYRMKHFLDQPLTAEAKFGYYFVQWADSVTDNPRMVNVTGDTAFRAQYDRRTFYVTVVVDTARAHGSGTRICRYLDYFPITITPKHGYHFVQWSDGNTQNPRYVTCTGNATYTAQMAPDQFTVSGSANQNLGTISGLGNHDYMSTATLTATPNHGYLFDHWNDGVTANPRSVVVTKDTAFEAFFVIGQYTVTAASANATMGSAAGTTTVNYLDTVQISATANAHYHFVKWNDNNTQNPRKVVATNNVTYTAQFAADNYTVTGLADQGMGSVTGSGSYAYLSNATLTAVPACGYLFDHWSNDSTATTITVKVTGPTTLTAYFRPAVVDTVTVTVHDTTVVTNTVIVHDTTYVDIHDSVDVTVYVHDTTTVEVPVYVHDTTMVEVLVHDTTTVEVPVYVHDTTMVEVPVYVHDTTYIDIHDSVDVTVYVYVHDTTTVEVPVYMHDTTTVEVPVYVHDTTTVEVPVYVHDTTTVEVPVYVYDTTTVEVPVYVYDTTTIEVPVHDTTTIEVPVHDTTTVTEYIVDTLWLTEYIHDTVWQIKYIYDTIYIHDTIFVGIDDVEALDAKIYANNGQIVVEGADGNKVVLYDVTGRILATKVDEYAPLRFDIPVSGTYLVKIGNHAARRIVMIR